MNILFLTPQIPCPPWQGTTLRNYHLIEGLAEHHAVSLLSFQEPMQPADATGWGRLPELCETIVTVPMPTRTTAQRLLDLIRTKQPDMALRLQSSAFARRLTDWLGAESFDIVHIEGIEMAPYLPLIATVPDAPSTLFDDHNAEYVLQKRAFETDLRLPHRWHAAAYSFLQWRRLRRFEAQICRAADHVVAVSDTDRLALEALRLQKQVWVIPNCIDVASYALPSDQPETVPAFTLLFTGKMDFRPNIDAALWFGQEIWPLIKAEEPAATWGIVGKSPHPRLDALRSDPSITIVGQVPEMPPYLQAAQIYIIPLRIGGGTRFKLLEAMAAGTVVVSTAVGAEGVPVRTGRDLLLADHPADFAAAVLRLLRDPDLRDRFSFSSLALVREQFDWRIIVPSLEEIYGH